MTLQPADFQAIADARRELGIPDDVEATSAEVLQLLRIVPEEVAVRMLDGWRDQAQQGHDCWMRDHDAQIDYWRGMAS